MKEPLVIRCDNRIRCPKRDKCVRAILSDKFDGAEPIRSLPFNCCDENEWTFWIQEFSGKLC